MTVKERIFHSILFELLALSIIVLVVSQASSQDATAMTGLAASLSVIAMSWNYLYNLGFDRLFGAERLSRGLWKRIGHSIGFEGGLTLASLPLIMWVLKLGVWQALLADIGLTVFFLIYALLFNWSYDIIRAKLQASNTVTLTNE